MKRTAIAITLAAVLAAVLASCSESSGNNGSGTSTNTGTSTSTGTGTADPGLPDYELIYDRGGLYSFHLVFTRASWDFLMADPKRKEYVPATFVWERAGGDETVENVGMRFKGNSSLNAPPVKDSIKKSFKIDFNRYVEGRQFHSCKKLNLNNNFSDQTLMKEMLAYDLFNAAGVPAPHTSHVNVYLTVEGGDYTHEYLGVYTSVEQVHRDFLKDRFNDNDGNLYKAGDGLECAKLTWRGADKEAYKHRDDYELKTNEEEDDWSDFIEFIHTLNFTPDDEFRDTFGAVFEVERFLEYLAVNTLLSYEDSYQGTAHNFFLYHNQATGKWIFIPWDLNSCFGACRFNDKQTGRKKTADYMLEMDALTPIFDYTDRPLVTRILAVPEFRDMYRSKLEMLLDGPFTNALIDPQIDAIHERIKDDVYADPYKYCNNYEFDTLIAHDLPNEYDPRRRLGIKDFVTRRNQIVRNQIDE
jgi:spore coat protein CotH